MAQADLEPDLVLCSSARRAQDTWNRVSKKLASLPEVEVRDDLYDASVQSLMSILQEVPDTIHRVLMVGHNPTFEDLARNLVGDGEVEARREMELKFPTGALAVIDFPSGNWSQVEGRSGFLRAFVKPRSLRR